ADARPEAGSSARAALASEASGQRGNSSEVRAHSASEDARKRAGDTRPEPGSSTRAVLASEASGQRGNSFEVRAHSASEDARKRAGATRPEPGSSTRVAQQPTVPAIPEESSLDTVFAKAMAAVNGKLKDPQSARYRDMVKKVGPDVNGKPAEVVCGSINAKDSSGVYRG